MLHCPSNTTPSWITRLGDVMLPKSFPGDLISRRFLAVTSPVTRPRMTTELPTICAFTTALSPMVRASCAVISPSIWPSMRTGPSNVSFPTTRLPFPRNALLPLPLTSSGMAPLLSPPPHSPLPTAPAPPEVAGPASTPLPTPRPAVPHARRAGRADGGRQHRPPIVSLSILPEYRHRLLRACSEPERGARAPATGPRGLLAPPRARC